MQRPIVHELFTHSRCSHARRLFHVLLRPLQFVSHERLHDFRVSLHRDRDGEGDTSISRSCGRPDTLVHPFFSNGYLRLRVLNNSLRTDQPIRNFHYSRSRAHDHIYERIDFKVYYSGVDTYVGVELEGVNFRGKEVKDIFLERCMYTRHDTIEVY